MGVLTIPMELQEIAPNFQIPIVTLIEKGGNPFSMFYDFCHVQSTYIYIISLVFFE